MKKTYNIVIIDDDELAIDNLVLNLKAFDPFEVAGTARNGTTGKKLLMKTHPHLLFLDIELPDMNGLELLKDIKDEVTWNMHVIFYTAFDKYMLQAIRESAFDYLLKPIDTKELSMIINRFLNNISAQQGTTAPSYIQLRGLANLEETFIFPTPTNDLQVFRTEDIGYFKYNSERRQWEVYPCNHTKILLKRNITAENILKCSPAFVQIHQSFIININYLVTIKEKRCVLYPPFDNVTDLQISLIFRKKLLDMFHSF